jgi:chemotaxis-related protein WspB
MLFLLFQLGEQRFALEAARVVEVVPLVAMKGLSHAPCGFAGILNYRGQPVPALDLCELTLGRPAAERLGTRVIIIPHANGEGAPRLLGLIAENATQILNTRPENFVETGVRLKSAPYLGPLLMDPNGPVQWLREDRLLSAPMRELLDTLPELGYGLA